MQRILQRIPKFRRLSQSSTVEAARRAFNPRSAFNPRIPFRYQQQNRYIEVARFTLLSIATLPFTLWLASFSYDYYYRVELCLESLKQEDEELRIRHTKDHENVAAHRGRRSQLHQVRTLLAKDPHQVVLVAGANESGKSQFVSEVLRCMNAKSGRKKRGVTHIQLAQLVDSVSSFTYILVNSFNLKWLSLRYSLVDVLPFAGSEILVMKERFSDRDLAQALNVITEALKKNFRRGSSQDLPVIVIDGLAEGKSWARTQEGKQCLERLFQWCIYVTKERQLAHIVLTGNEELVLSLTEQNRMTRGHVKVIGLGDLQEDEARELVLQEMPDASEEEVQKIIAAFGGFVHDVLGSSRDIQDRLSLSGSFDPNERAKIVNDVISTRCRMQFERVTAAFAKGHDALDDTLNSDTPKDGEEEEMDPYLDPLKVAYSEAQASQSRSALNDSDGTVSYTKLQLWQTLQRLVDSKDGSIAFAELRDDIFGGAQTPILELMDDDVLGFEIEDSQTSGFSWKVKPATPALHGAFGQIVRDNRLKERFINVEQQSNRQDEMREVGRERRNIRRKRKELEELKVTIRSTVELGEKLDPRIVARSRLNALFTSLVKEEHDTLVRDYQLRHKLKSLEESDQKESNMKPSKSESEVQQLRNYLSQIMIQQKLSEDSSSDDTEQKIWAAFQELDETNDGVFDAEDIVRVIKVHTGKEVSLEAAQKLVQAWDFDNDDSIDFDEFTRMVFETANKDENVKAKIRKATLKASRKATR